MTINQAALKAERKFRAKSITEIIRKKLDEEPHEAFETLIYIQQLKVSKMLLGGDQALVNAFNDYQVEEGFPLFNLQNVAKFRRLLGSHVYPVLTRLLYKMKQTGSDCRVYEVRAANLMKTLHMITSCDKGMLTTRTRDRDLANKTEINAKESNTLIGSNSESEQERPFIPDSELIEDQADECNKEAKIENIQRQINELLADLKLLKSGEKRV